MEQIKFSDFRIIPILSSAKKVKMPDNEYFSSKYSGYISNSRLGYINPLQSGSPEKYQKGFTGETTSSLVLGSAIHELILQPESFELGPKCDKPTAKLGMTIDRVKYYRKQGDTIYNAIVKASNDCNYYVNQIDNKISKIIKEGFSYYWKSKDFDDSIITLSDKEWDTCKACVDKVNSDQNIQNALHPKDDFKYDLPSFNEDAIFLDVIVTYKDKFKILKLKMKADNWTIDEENKILTLNDLKTTSKPVHWFMNSDYGSFYKYHYYRQFAMYLMMLEQYCIKEYGYNKDWQSKCNVLVVGTVDCDSKLYRVNKNQLVFGKMEYENLLKRVAYYELFGYTKEVEFID